MSTCKALFLILGLAMTTPAQANAAHEEELASTLAEIGPALGRIDYSLFDSYAREFPGQMIARQRAEGAGDRPSRYCSIGSRRLLAAYQPIAADLAVRYGQSIEL